MHPSKMTEILDAIEAAQECTREVILAAVPMNNGSLSRRLKRLWKNGTLRRRKNPKYRGRGRQYLYRLRDIPAPTHSTKETGMKREFIRTTESQAPDGTPCRYYWTRYDGSECGIPQVFVGGAWRGLEAGEYGTYRDTFRSIAMQEQEDIRRRFQETP